MNAPFTNSDAKAKSASPDTCVRSRRMLRSNLRIVETARELFPIKTALQLTEITGYPLRTVEHSSAPLISPWRSEPTVAK